jgi:hypothetical protein
VGRDFDPQAGAQLSGCPVRPHSRMSIRLKVECYSGYKADERPQRFTFAPAIHRGHLSGDRAPRTYEVQEVIDQWYGPGYRCFKIRADDNNLYILRHSGEQDGWTLDSFRRESGR